jgi:hypothetical protein
MPKSEELNYEVNKADFNTVTSGGDEHSTARHDQQNTFSQPLQLPAIEEEDKKKLKVFDLCKVREQAINLGLLMYIWSQNQFCSQMINFYTKYIPGDTYNNMLANYMIDIPAHFVGGMILTYVGIRMTYIVGSSSALLGGILLLFFGAPGADIPDFAFIFMVVLAKGGVLMMMDASYLANATLFPPAYAGLSFGMCAFTGKMIASMSSLTAEFDHPIPMIIFCVLTCMTYPVAFSLQIKGAKNYLNFKK